MKKFISILIVAFLALSVNAQVKQDIKKGAKKVGNKTAEVASKSKAEVTDAKHKSKVGPQGQTIYIDNHSRYYWVDRKGKRHYVTSRQLKDKPQ